MERRIALVAKAQATKSSRSMETASVSQQPRSSCDADGFLSDNERKRKLAKATEVAEARHATYDLKVCYVVMAVIYSKATLIIRN